MQSSSPHAGGIILASTSPRRSELLTRMGVRFTIMDSEADENIDWPGPEAVVTLARRKAEAAAARVKAGIVLAADTIVWCQDQVLGKPRDASDAQRMLTMMAGRWHDVYTGLCVLDAATGEMKTAMERTRVHFTPIDALEIARYVASGEPMDKAGAYGIQGRAGMFIDAIEGSPSNVMGLPMATARALLIDVGILPA